ncbi:MAG: ATP-binding protein [Candidatus Dormibacteria bacterium]
MTEFVGRVRELRLLSEQLQAVRGGAGGRFVWMRGRRRVGKSRLVEEFLDQEGVPYLFFQAPRRRRDDALERFRSALASSTLPAAAAVQGGATFATWPAALELAATGATAEKPLVVVIDELPYLVEQDDGFPSDLQEAWDRRLQRQCVLLICVGSDIRMMRALTEYPAELHDRPTREIRVPPFSPRELAALSSVSPEQAFDRYVVVGGFPILARSWPPSLSRKEFLTRSLVDSANALVVNAQRILAAEFDTELQARDVLAAIGHGGTTFNVIRGASGVSNEKSLTRALQVLVSKGLVEASLPYAAPPGKKDRRYLVVDPYLRFWLRFIAPNIDEIDRGRGDLLVARIERDWLTFRGKAIEPIVRKSVERLLPDPRFRDARFVGSYWTRTNDPEVDLVGAADQVHPTSVDFVGSIKWRENAPFTRRDTEALIEARAKVPGAWTALLVGVSRSGFSAAGLDIELTASDLLEGWPAS